ncbi:Deoxyribose-phosphate aldolase [Caldanaerobacter subterraneus subsp. tengcongensis MB4]|uniref:Deoxyribose-phosphate aldolase n=2 Tax=Caldanaerobacter subterraneus TaxID=911092 RepID=DEOC_CALS4|nr:RecName: Full=Deoxyribose-phosphate aldolase; Short=DERA; AltName: Full=2-deoxy-D-ribose 5-phosphate aldolase; AltName: Full=Phosphodeoxyriboaldolase; Short=Deoxyriboaldolase [Caldanaerobacter subterraneus subsp. tengcongensis MB4]AAM24230.1 Deoxyribose-phosphate aldolase [Caldanaerobacter subterraneus subsp. tengcongensis MB4]
MLKKEESLMNIAKMIDHTLLKPNATKEEIKKVCEEAREYGFASVCINPCFVDLAYEMLKDTDVKVCTVVGFPLGANTIETKVVEAVEAVKKGATEIDMVLNISMLKSGEYDYVKKEIGEVVKAVKSHGDIVVKVILETCYLSDEEKIKACEISKEAGADFVKTSTGFGPGGATVEDVKLMRKVVGENFGVKASGGIRSYEDAKAMIEAGANRIGASAGVKIVEEWKKQGLG